MHRAGWRHQAASGGMRQRSCRPSMSTIRRPSGAFPCVVWRSIFCAGCSHCSRARCHARLMKDLVPPFCRQFPRPAGRGLEIVRLPNQEWRDAQLALASSWRSCSKSKGILATSSCCKLEVSLHAIPPTSYCAGGSLGSPEKDGDGRRI